MTSDLLPARHPRISDVVPVRHSGVQPALHGVLPVTIVRSLFVTVRLPLHLPSPTISVELVGAI